MHDNIKTPLDEAHIRAEKTGVDIDRRLFFIRLAETELYLLLGARGGDIAQGEIKPKLFNTEDGTVALAFDRPERLEAFAGGAAEYAVLSGRALSEILAHKSICLGLNLGTVHSAQILTPAALKWMTNADLEQQFSGHDIRRMLPPKPPCEVFLKTLGDKVARATGLISGVFIVDIEDMNDCIWRLIAIAGATLEVRAALRQSFSELGLLGESEAPEKRIIFLEADDPLRQNLKKMGLYVEAPRLAPPIYQAKQTPISPPILSVKKSVS